MNIKVGDKVSINSRCAYRKAIGKDAVVDSVEGNIIFLKRGEYNQSTCDDLAGHWSDDALDNFRLAFYSQEFDVI